MRKVIVGSVICLLQGCVTAQWAAYCNGQACQCEQVGFGGYVSCTPYAQLPDDPGLEDYEQIEQRVRADAQRHAELAAQAPPASAPSPSPRVVTPREAEAWREAHPTGDAPTPSKLSASPERSQACDQDTGADLLRAGKRAEAITCWRSLLPLAESPEERDGPIVAIERASLQPDRDLTGVTPLQLQVADAWARSAEEARAAAHAREQEARAAARAVTACQGECTLAVQACRNSNIDLGNYCGRDLAGCFARCDDSAG